MSKIIKNKTYSRVDGSSFHRKSIRINGEKIEKVFSRKVDADRWYQDKRREKELAESGLSPIISDITVSDFSKDWHEKRKTNGKPFSSWSSDDGRLKKWILPAFGARNMNKITTKEWESFLDGLVADEHVSPATRNRIRSLLTKMYNDGMRQELLSTNPVRIIPQLKESMDAWDYWSSTDDIINYLNEAKIESDSFFLFACLSLNLGTRIGEILALDHSDVNLNHRRIQISKVFEEASGKVFQRTKGHKERWLGINDALYEAISEHKKNVGFCSSTDPLICNERGARVSERVIRNMHLRVCKKAKVKEIRIHDLRHTYASHYIMNGGSLAELQSLLGHSSPMMTLKYAHMTPGFLEKKASVVSFSVPKQNVIPLRSVI
ncbi:MAG: tyrosine-type recombinase/integrase [Bdellovibrionaceae bacterium]|nr:tyrosine-type recombinase/integrase [Pseudobdellovibrionaceae bacterium]